MRKLYKDNTANYPRLKTDKFFVDYENSYQFNGFIDETIKYIEDFQLLRPELWQRFVYQFRSDADADGGWRGEYWGKMMRGACFTYSYTKNKALYDVLTATVKDMILSADLDGRISTYPKDNEFHHWDIWSRKYVLLGMQYFMEICEDDEFSKEIIACMCRQADYIMSKIGDTEGKTHITKASHHWRGLNSSSLLEPIVRLYNITGEQKYLDFATYIVNAGGTEVVNIFELAYKDELYPYQYPITKAYEMTSCFEGLLEYYRVVGTEWHKTAVINFANKVLESDFTIIGSCGCTHELFDHSTVRQANTTNGIIAQETCVTVTLMKFMYQLSLLTGDPKYSDAFEISMYNAYLGSINTEKVIEPKIKREHPDWAMEPLPFDSYSPLTAGTRGNGVGGLKVMSDMHYYGCCACIGAAGNGLMAKMAALATDGGIVLNMYFNGTIKTKTPSGNALIIKTDTKYPVDGKIHIELQTAKEEFKILLRNPAFSENTKITVCGESIPVNKGYVSINRLWNTGDSIDILLDMRTKAIKPTPYGSQVLMNEVIWGANYMIPTFDKEDEKAKYHLALIRGPIVLAQENRLGYSVDTPVDIKVNSDGCVDVTIPSEFKAPYKNILELCVPLSDGTQMHVTDYASAGKLWTNDGKMAAWILTKTAQN